MCKCVLSWIWKKLLRKKNNNKKTMLTLAKYQVYFPTDFFFNVGSFFSLFGGCFFFCAVIKFTELCTLLSSIVRDRGKMLPSQCVQFDHQGSVGDIFCTLSSLTCVKNRKGRY